MEGREGGDKKVDQEKNDVPKRRMNRRAPKKIEIQEKKQTF